MLLPLVYKCIPIAISLLAVGTDIKSHNSGSTQIKLANLFNKLSLKNSLVKYLLLRLNLNSLNY